jgi:periplasmic protein TonB
MLPLIARPRDPPPPLSENGEVALRRRSLAASAALHAGIVLALLLLLRSTPLPEEPVVKVTVLQDGPGAAGAAGGAGGGGDAREAQSASAQAPPKDTPPAAPPANETPAETEAEAAPSAAPPQLEPPPSPASPTATAAALDSPPPPPRQKPRLSHEHRPPRTSPTPRAAETPSEGPVQIAAVPAITPTPGTPGAGSGPGGTRGVGSGADGAGHGAIGNGPLEGPGDDYLQRLKRWLNKYKHYPKDAIDKKQEGRLVVSFVILRDGTVLDPRIEHSSGIPSLDAAAIEMLHAASPVPPLPETYRGERATLDLPVGYSIGLLDKLF